MELQIEMTSVQDSLAGLPAELSNFAFKLRMQPSCPGQPDPRMACPLLLSFGDAPNLPFVMPPSMPYNLLWPIHHFSPAPAKPIAAPPKPALPARHSNNARRRSRSAKSTSSHIASPRRLEVGRIRVSGHSWKCPVCCETVTDWTARLCPRCKGATRPTPPQESKLSPEAPLATEWGCSKCQQTNFGWRTVCNACNEARLSTR